MNFLFVRESFKNFGFSPKTTPSFSFVTWFELGLGFWQLSNYNSICLWSHSYFISLKFYVVKTLAPDYLGQTFINILNSWKKFAKPGKLFKNRLSNLGIVQEKTWTNISEMFWVLQKLNIQMGENFISNYIAPRH